jgi:hypothetical protein
MNTTNYSSEKLARDEATLVLTFVSLDGHLG